MDELEVLSRGMTSRGFRPKTKKSYGHIFEAFRKFSGKDIKESSADGVKRYLACLNERGYTNIYLNVIISALKFSFSVLGKELEIKRPRKEK